MNMKVASIKVGERFRKEFGDIEELADSIRKYGVLEPIIVNKDGVLIAGERRLRAATLAGLETVPVVVREVDELSSREIELLENILRKDLTDEEQVELVAEIHRVRQRMTNSQTRKGVSGEWTLDDTANLLGYSHGKVSMMLTIHKAKEESPRVKEVLRTQGASAAYKAYLDEEHTKAVSLVVEDIKEETTKKSSDELMPIASSMLLHGDCRELIKTIPDKSVDLIYTDPPYGVDLADLVKKRCHSLQTRIYEDDSEEGVIQLMEQLAPEFWRVLKDDGWVFVWTGTRVFRYNTLNLMLDHGFKKACNLFVWIRQGGTALLAPEFVFVPAVDPAFVVRKGTPRLLRQGLPNYVMMPPLAPGKRVHPLDRPVELGMEIISRFVAPGQMVLDPFAGGGSTLRSCIKLGISCKGFEIDKGYYDAALLALIDALAS